MPINYRDLMWQPSGGYSGPLGKPPAIPSGLITRKVPLLPVGPDGSPIFPDPFRLPAEPPMGPKPPPPVDNTLGYVRDISQSTLGYGPRLPSSPGIEAIGAATMPPLPEARPNPPLKPTGETLRGAQNFDGSPVQIMAPPPPDMRTIAGRTEGIDGVLKRLMKGNRPSVPSSRPKQSRAERFAGVLDQFGMII